MSGTPNSTTSALPASQSHNALTSQPPTKVPTPVPDRPLPHNSNKSSTSTPPPDMESRSGSGGAKVNGAASAEKADKEKAKRKEKKERKDKERADRSRDSASTPDGPPSTSSPSLPEPSTSGALDVGKPDGDDVKSPVEGSTGVRTPKFGKPPRNPWTIFMRMQPNTEVSESEIRVFFGEAKDGVSLWISLLVASH